MENERMRENRNVNANADARTRITTREWGRAEGYRANEYKQPSPNKQRRKETKENWKTEDRNE